MKFVSIPEPIDYAEAVELQLKWVNDRIHDRVEDTILLLEHRPVITKGSGIQKGGAAENASQGLGLPLLPPVLPDGIQLVETSRGGDLTYHGPGQLVGYPIVKLGPGGEFSPHKDISRYLRRMEASLSRTLGTWGLDARGNPDATGVWVDSPDGPSRKIASIGVAVKRWVTYHGFALNVVNDLKPFHLFSPCGFSPEVMTRLSDLLPEKGEWADWRAEVEERIQRNFVPESQFSSVAQEDAKALSGLQRHL